MELYAHIRNRMINVLNKIDKLSKEAQEIIKYNDESEKIKVLNALSAGAKILNISKPYKQGKYYRIYVDVE